MTFDRRWLSRWGPYLAILGAVLLVYRRVLLRGEIFFFADIATQNYPWKAFFAEQIRACRLPLWFPYMHSGFPLYAEIQAGFFYPVNLVAFLLLATPLAYGVVQALHLLLCGVGLFGLARERGLEPVPALFAALSFIYSAFFFLHLVHLSMYLTACWLPVLMLLLERALRRERAGLPLLLFSAALALQILAGHPQIVAISMLVLALRVLAHLAGGLREREAVRALRPAVLWAGAVVLALWMSGAQLLPTLGLIEHSVRAGGVSSTVADAQSVPPWGLLTYVFPRFFGLATPEADVDFWLVGLNYWEVCPYAGILPLLLMFVPLFRRPLGSWRFEYVLLGGSILLMLGSYLPFYGLLCKIPPFHYFRVSARFSLTASLAISLLSGYGLQVLTQGARERWERAARRATLLAGVLLGAALAGVCAGYLLLRTFREPIRQRLLAFGSAFIRENVHGKGLFLKPLDYYLGKLDWAVELILTRLGDALNPTLPGVYLPLLFLASAVGLFGLRWKGRIGTRTFQAAALCLLLADLSLFGLAYNRSMPVARALAPSPVVEELWRLPRGYRVLRDIRAGDRTVEEERRLLPVSMGALWGVESADEFTPLKTARYDRALRILREDEGYVLHGVLGHRNLMSLMGIRYLLTPEPVEDPAWHRVSVRDGVAIYENPEALPLVFFAGAYEVVDAAGAGRRLADPAIDFGRTALLEEPPPFPSAGAAGASAAVEVTHVSRAVDAVTARVRNARPGVLVLRVTCYPGWRAVVDGSEQAPVRVDDLYQGVFLGPGEHEVTFAFRPRDLWLGGLASATGWLAWGALLVRVFRRERAVRLTGAKKAHSLNG